MEHSVSSITIFVSRYWGGKCGLVIVSVSVSVGFENVEHQAL